MSFTALQLELYLEAIVVLNQLVFNTKYTMAYLVNSYIARACSFGRWVLVDYRHVVGKQPHSQWSGKVGARCTIEEDCYIVHSSVKLVIQIDPFPALQTMK